MGPFSEAIKVNITFSKCARVKERTSENRMNQGIGVLEFIVSLFSTNKFLNPTGNIMSHI